MRFSKYLPTLIDETKFGERHAFLVFTVEVIALYKFWWLLQIVAPSGRVNMSNNI